MLAQPTTTHFGQFTWCKCLLVKHTSDIQEEACVQPSPNSAERRTRKSSRPLYLMRRSHDHLGGWAVYVVPAQAMGIEFKIARYHN
jgi:hypothetical protein